MDPKMVYSVLVIAGIVLVLTGVIQILGTPGMMVYLSTFAGIVLVFAGLYGLKTGKIF